MQIILYLKMCVQKEFLWKFGLTQDGSAANW